MTWIWECRVKTEIIYWNLLGEGVCEKVVLRRLANWQVQKEEERNISFLWHWERKLKRLGSYNKRPDFCALSTCLSAQFVSTKKSNCCDLMLLDREILFSSGSITHSLEHWNALQSCNHSHMRKVVVVQFLLFFCHIYCCRWYFNLPFIRMAMAVRTE